MMKEVEEDDSRFRDDGAFGAAGGTTMVSAFDAFPKAKAQFLEQTEGGGKWTAAMLIVSVVLLWSEVAHWWRGEELHTFSVEKGISQHLQINLDVVVPMVCGDVHVNAQDAVGDWIKAAQLLQKDPTVWEQWLDERWSRTAGGRVRKLGYEYVDGEGDGGGGGDGMVKISGHQALLRHDEGFGEEHVHDIVEARRKTQKWTKTPRIPRGAQANACRLYGSWELNKIQGDFHITARGHGYQSSGGHLDHARFNFSHIINELSFGSFYPSLVNPLDRTVNAVSAADENADPKDGRVVDNHFYKFQYHLSVVPTVYSLGMNALSTSARSAPRIEPHAMMRTNQYAVTQRSGPVREMGAAVPGIFFQYEIEPILLSVVEYRASWLALAMKMVNVVSGAFVASHWAFRLHDWAGVVWGRRKRLVTRGMLGEKDHL